MPRKRYAKPGDLTQLRGVLWQQILDVRALTDNQPASPELVVRSAHALAQLAGVYTKLVESSELEERVRQLEVHARETPSTR
jgi:hypothetical protein